MDSQDHKKPTISTGHEGHGVHLCHRCGWPFPNPHPSARHRRAHKKLCGKIEGYKIIQSEEDGHHLAVSDDEHGSDDDLHTPSPNVMKANVKDFGGSGGVGEKSNRSEDDVFSDAVMEFAESGISPPLEERYESMKELNKSAEQKTVEDDLSQRKIQKVDESADRTEQLNDPRSNNQACDSAAPINEEDQSESVVLINDAKVEAVSAGQSFVESEIQRDLRVDNMDGFGDSVVQQGLTKAGGEADINGNEIKSASIPLDSEDPKTSEPAVSVNAAKINEDAPSVPEVKSIADSAGVSESENTPAIGSEEAVENIEASSNEAKVSESVKVFSSIGAVDENTSAVIDSSAEIISVNENISASLSGRENAEDRNGARTGDKNRSNEPTDNISVESVSGPDYCLKSYLAHEDDHISTSFSNDKQVNCKLLDACSDLDVMLDSKVQSVNSSDCQEAGSDAEKLSATEDVSIESGAGGLQKSLQGLDCGTVAGDVLQEVGSAQLDKSSPAATLEDLESSELPNNNNNVTSDIAEGVESVARNVVELENNGHVVTSEKAPPPSKDSDPLLTDSEFKSESSANDISCSSDDAGVSVHDGNGIVLSGKPETPTLEVLPVNRQSSTEVLPDLEEQSRASEDTTSKSKCPGIVLSENEPLLPSPLDSQNLNDAAASSDDKNVTLGESPSQDATQTKERDGISEFDFSGGSVSISDSLEGKCGSASENSEINLQKTKTANEAERFDKDVFEPPSFMTLVQSGGEVNNNHGALEIENVQQPKSDSLLQAGWFPSLTNVVNESEGRKKNEEIIAKVTNWSPGKQHGPLKNLLNEAKSPNTKQKDYSTDGKREKDEGGNNNKEMEKEWNSPARYPIEIKKEKKKKGRPYWVPFVCCSSVHRDL